MAITASPRTFRFMLNCWPPYLGAGIRVRHIAPDWSEAIVDMRLRWYNRNNFGTHFGGSLFAMTDPFYALLILHRLGPEYWVWDKAAEIDFVRPGKGRVTAVFRIEETTLQTIRAECQDGDKHLCTLPVEVKDASGDTVAAVSKTVYIRKKRSRRTSEE